MASPNRSSHAFWGKANDNNTRRHLDPQQPVLDVAPLNSVPYTGPPPPSSNFASSPIEIEIDHCSVLRNQPAMVFLPPHATEKELNDIIAVTKNGVVVSGSAARGKVGPTLGSVDIAESEDAYLFRVSLPGVARDEKGFQLDVELDGKILIRGVTTTGEKKVYKHKMVFEMQSQNLCPPGDFLVSFQLPGPVDPQGLNALYGTDGIFEGVVKKKIPKSF